MGKLYELKSVEVRRTCPLEILPFETTDELKPVAGIIGQERAVRSMEFGLQVRRDGYNIFMVGPSGTGKLTYAQTITKQIAATEPVPADWCYVNNFEHPDQAVAIAFPAGEGKIFADRVQKILEDLIDEIPRVYESEEYETQKNETFNFYQNTKNGLMDELEDFAHERSFVLQEKRTGIVTIAALNGKAITQEEYDALSEEEQDSIHLRSEEIQRKAVEIFRKSRELEREYQEAMDALDLKTGTHAVEFLFRPILAEYANNAVVLKYLRAYKKDVIDSLQEFRSSEEQSELPFLDNSDDDSFFARYQVNLLVDNSETLGAPVIFEPNPTFYRLMGKIEYASKVGSLVTSFLQIKPGVMHLANGGYIILNVEDLLFNPESWYALKRALKTQEIQIENLGENYGLVTVSSLRPEPIPLKLKVILIGNPQYYYTLLNLDDDYDKLFKIKVDFDWTMDWTEENILDTARFVKAYSDQHKLLPFNTAAVAELIIYSSRLAGEQDKLTTHFNHLAEILNEAETWARLEGSDIVRCQHMKKAVKEKILRNNRYEELIQKEINDGTLLIECHGKKVGQVNALVVLDFGDYRFGHPTKVTAVAYRGQRGVIHIERETKMSGAVHDKGLMILSNFLGARYAQSHPLNITASLTFEQVYDGIDGDSASCAELVTLLSGIAQIPLYQSIAITGSFNQHGDIQPIGGVTEKVEGFFRTCKAFGLTGEQGVIIPHKNVKNLTLSDEVTEAIEKNLFHIYPIYTVDEAIEILTGLPVGHLKRDNTYPHNTVNYLVEERLREFSHEEKRE